jgi:chaperonin cofactor prefoldin|tara:strand:- start:704 stop:1027 length:324 start_codon:yes stop_codon:yes gene_type:complete
MKKLVISEDQFGRMFKHTISEQSEGGWVQMDDEEKREYLQQFTSDGDKIETLLRSPEDPTREFEGMSDDGASGDMTVERSTDDIIADMEGDVGELQRSLKIIRSRMS